MKYSNSIFLSTILTSFISVSIYAQQSGFTIRDIQLLELDETTTAYDPNNDTELTTIIENPTINQKLINEKKSLKISNDDWQKTKLIYFFIYYKEILKSDDQATTTLKNSKGRIYYKDTNNTENYYGVGSSLTGKNLVGKMVQKMRDDQTYIPRIEQKVDISDEFLLNIQNKAQTYKKKHQTWNSIQNGIYFYNRTDSYYEFTNFYESKVLVNGHIWPTSEHSFQASKFTLDEDIQQSIKNAKTPRDAFDIAQNNKQLLYQLSWQKESLPNMIKVVWYKFNQNEALKNLLLNTKDQILIEDAGQHDAFYGAGQDYKGENWLGCILMAVRDTIREQQKTNQPVSNSKSPAQKTVQPTPSRSTKTFQSTTNPKRPSSSLPQQKSFFQWLFEWFTSWFD